MHGDRRVDFRRKGRVSDMHILEGIVQGSSQWLAIRAKHLTASEAPAAAGVSKYQSRSDLLRQKATGIVHEVDAQTQKLYDRGHASEAGARPLAEDIIGSELYPVTATLSIEGLDLLASLDGATMMEDIIFEHKLWSEPLAADVRAGTLAPHYTVQMDQELMVSGAKRCLFMVSDGTPENMVWCWYESSQEKFDALIATWKQFAADLAAYIPTEAPVPVAAGKAPETLPALRIEVTGMVTASNLAEFKQTALAAIRSVNRELTTDADFANAESAVKWCGEVESRLAAAKEHALSQTASIDALFKTIDDISAEARQVRLELDKLVKHRKESIRGEIVAGAVGAFAKHVRELSASLGRGALPPINVDFAGAIKGKRTVASLRDAVDTELARVKIEANAIYQRMVANERALADQPEHAFLFPDWNALLHKAPDDLAAVIAARIAEHKAKEAARIEAETARIRAEEQAKAQREAAAQAAAKVAAKVSADAAADLQARRDSEAAAARAAEPPTSAPVAVPAVAIAAAAPVPRTAQRPEPATLNMGAICSRLGITMTAAFVSESLGIQPAATDKQAKLFRESQFPAICDALVRHIAAVSELQAA